MSNITKIGIFQDVHANLPALKKAISVFKHYQCSKIYHVGDLIGIGPFPREVMDLAISIEEMEFIMGNHDYWYAFGLPNPIPSYMNKEEVEHHQWTHQQIGDAYKEIVQNWPFTKKLTLSDDLHIAFQHYGIDEASNWFKPFVKQPNGDDLNRMFNDSQSDMIFYGHDHNSSDISGNCRYINLGSAGCFNKPAVRIAILEIANSNPKLEKLSMPYSDEGFMDTFEIRQVPAKDFIKKNLITWL